MSDPDPRTAAARILNRGGVSAAPMARLPILSIFDDDEYENYDIDMIPPRRRSKLVKALVAEGYRQSSGRRIKDPDGARFEFPRPAALGTDPSRPAADLLGGGGSVLVTPTQALLLYLHRCGDLGAGAVADELRGLVWEQPANLAKVAEWTRPAGRGALFAELRPVLDEAQREGIDLRKRREFRSRLPR